MDIDPRDLRNALGRFATGVCVITTVSREGEPLGLTANSFASVSLEPPLVLWSLQNNSEVYDAFASPRYYAINVLASEHMALSNRYAKKGDHRLDPAHIRFGRHGAPVLRDALVSFECELHATHDGGDHVIIVGRIRDMLTRPTGEPLLFYCGAYRELH
ncbi:flavin reductase [Mangrovimicrobium sediminis]|uniref:Flavin reductase n=1 Tax=Mangrovimicrobium sediminis TaxID=2562682 RepID=A0A4Z0M6X8_9GAMM|nr:flavin reductase family protein [Haliea sp. SAOS-164]TGD75254.1 flavin reductase [Haliea sp. SAOS-164]